MTRTVAIVPMRHNSERVPGKNYRPLAGIPLYHHVIRTLSAVPEIDLIVIDTDSEFIIADCAEHFPEVQVLLRPEHLRDGAIAMNDVLLNTLDQVDADIALQTHSTNPFLKTETVSAALKLFTEPGHDFDSVFSVTRLQARLWDGQTRAVLFAVDPFEAAFTGGVYVAAADVTRSSSFVTSDSISPSARRLRTFSFCRMLVM